MTRTRNLLGAAGLLLLTACPLPKELRENPPPPVHTDMLVSANQLQRRLSDPTTVIVYVGQDRSGYDAGHVPGARFLPLSSIIADRDGVASELPDANALVQAFQSVGVSDDSHVVLYGDQNGLSAARAFFALDWLGHTPAVLDGGMQAWRAADKPVETAVPAARTGTLTAHLRPELVVDADWVRGHLRDSTVAFIDARPPEQFSGAAPGEGVTRPGHVPGAKNLFWQNTLVSASDQLLRSVDVVHALYRLAGARFASDVEVLPVRPSYEPGPTDTTTAAGRHQRDQENRRRERERRQREAERRNQPKPTNNTVVVYGRTGAQASWDYFVARYLGYDVKMYDAGFVDWSRRGDAYPVER